MNKIKTAVILIICMICLSCSETYTYEDKYINDPEISKPEVSESELFTSQNKDGEDDVYIFETCDDRYLTKNGYTLWSLKHTNENTDFEEFCVEVSKSSGSNDSGYGVVFCCQNIEEGSYMLSVMINNQGQYIVGEVKNGDFKSIVSWRFSNLLHRGSGISNNIKISYNSSTGKFLLEINGTDATTFKSGENLVFNGCKRGYVVVISPAENFPQKPVKVKFDEK